MLLSSKSLQGVLILAAIGVLSGCQVEPGRYTGGGTINSLGGAGRAQISFNADGCDTENVKGNLHYSDKTAIEYQTIGGVSFRGKVTAAGLCTAKDTGRPHVPGDWGGDPGCNSQYATLDENLQENPLDAECNPGQVAVLFDYTSSNPNAPGAGTGLLCAATAGAGAGGSLHAFVLPIILKTGPYMGYINGGSLIGNAMPHACDAPASES